MSSNTATIGKIPVRNLWLLMLYALDFRAHYNNETFSEEKSPEDIPDLIAEVLTRAVEDRLRRNLSVGFDRRQAVLTRVRGRIDHIRTERRRLLRQGRIACSFDALTADTPSNRFVKAALVVLGQKVRDKELGQRCRADATALEKAGVIKDGLRAAGLGVGNAPLMTASRAKPEDRRMLAAAELALNLRLPTEEAGRSNLPAPDRSVYWIRTLFEKAVGGFYDVKLSPQGWKIDAGSWIRWQVEQSTENMERILPGMERDIVLERPDTHTSKESRIVIDTKFTDIIRPSRHGTPRLDGKHIYQMYAYLRSQEKPNNDPPSMSASGILLHPSVGEDVDESATIQGHRIRFATVDLAVDYESMKDRLLGLVLE